MNAKGKSLLKIVGIINIILAIIVTISFLLILATKDSTLGTEIMKEAQLTNVELGLSVVDALILLFAGFTGIMYCNKPEYANINLIFGGLSLLMVIIGLFMHKITLYSIVGFILPLLYLLGAYLNKKMDIDAFREENNL